MLKNLREERNDEGFTLIELMVVVLIISILIAIAIPTFLGAREGAQDRGAQSNLRNGLTASKTLFANEGDYSTATATGLAAVEPSLTFTAATDVVDVAGSVSVAVTGTGSATITLAAWSESDTCYYIQDSGAGTTYSSVAAPTTCDADALTGVTFAGGGW